MSSLLFIGRPDGPAPYPILPLAKPSTATRTIGRGKGSSRGTVSDSDGRSIWFESELEYKHIIVLLTHPDVVSIHEQPQAVMFISPDGEVTDHTFDFIALMKSGLGVAVAVKPSHRATRPEFIARMQCVARDLPKSVADIVMIMTDDDVTSIQSRNAELYRSCLSFIDPAADDATMSAITTLNGWITLGSIGVLSGFAGWGYRAAVRALRRGDLSLEEPDDLITPDSFVRKRLAI
jgi:hypothetical protein